MADSRLFEKTLDSSPTDLTQRIAFGKAGQATKNITLSAFILWLKGKMNDYFMVRANNLSDVSNASTARTNLSVYSKAETFTQTEVNAAISVVNTKLGGLSSYSLYLVDKDGNETLLSGNSIPSITRISAGKYTITHNLNTLNYVVFSSARYSIAGDSFAGKVSAIEYHENYFDLYTSDDATLNDNSFMFELKLF